MRSLALIMILSALAVISCKKKDKIVHTDPGPSGFSRTMMTKYDGQSHDYCNCNVQRDNYFADSFQVWLMDAQWYQFTGSGPLSTPPKNFRTTDTFKFVDQNRTYSYKMVGDSIYASFSIPHSQCVEEYSFRGKRRR